MIGSLAIVSAVVFGAWSMTTGAAAYHQVPDTGWSFYLYILLRGIIVIALFVLLARYSFSLANSFMHESLKNGERLHAIKFGEFYLDAFGADAEWSDLKEAFEHWNITSNTAFSGSVSQLDDGEMERAIDRRIDRAISQSQQGNITKASTRRRVASGPAKPGNFSGGPG